MCNIESLRQPHLKKRKMKNAAKIGILGAIVSSLFGSGTLLAISCCAGPLVFLSLGLGWAGLAKFQFLSPYRWIFFGLTALFLTISFQRLYLSKNICQTSEDCASPRSIRYQRIAFWLTLGIVLAALLFPILYEKYLTR